jgi:hypothetical protein
MKETPMGVVYIKIVYLKSLYVLWCGVLWCGVLWCGVRFMKYCCSDECGGDAHLACSA